MDKSDLQREWLIGNSILAFTASMVFAVQVEPSTGTRQANGVNGAEKLGQWGGGIVYHGADEWV